jgi:hypothetical protein
MPPFSVLPVGVASFSRHFLYQTAHHHSYWSSGNVVDHKLATLLNIFYCSVQIYGTFKLCSNFPEMHLACTKYWMGTMQDNWGSDFWPVFGCLVPKLGGGGGLLWQVICCLGATDEAANNPDTNFWFQLETVKCSLLMFLSRNTRWWNSWERGRSGSGRVHEWKHKFSWDLCGSVQIMMAMYLQQDSCKVTQFKSQGLLFFFKFISWLPKIYVSFFTVRKY